jgi:hypothetical protein
MLKSDGDKRYASDQRRPKANRSNLGTQLGASFGRNQLGVKSETATPEKWGEPLEWHSFFGYRFRKSVHRIVDHLDDCIFNKNPGYIFAKRAPSEDRTSGEPPVPVHSSAMTYLNDAFQEMERDCDEPRVCQLLGRRAMIKFRDSVPASQASAMEDATRARALAEKYHEPHLLALSALALAIGARMRQGFSEAFQWIQEAEKNCAELKRIPQHVESIVEYLKILLIGFQDPSADKQLLLRVRAEIESTVNSLVVDVIPVFEPEFCYLMGMILNLYTDAPREVMLPWFVDAVNLSSQFNLAAQNAYFRETCARLGILEEVDSVISEGKARQAIEDVDPTDKD